jgi:hypothetical protein
MDMLDFYQVYDELFSELLERMDGAFSDLAEEALDWTPDPALNTITVLVFHTTGALRYWVGQILGDIPTQRDRGEEFKAKDLSKSQLHELIHDAEELVHQVMKSGTLEDLERKHYSVIHKDYFTGGFALAHALEHTALHLGHLEVMRELWEQFDWDQKA